MKIQAIKVNDHYLYSRENHDFRSLGEYSVDAGPGVGRILYHTTCPTPQWIEIKGVNYADLYNDWNSRENKYGIHPIDEVTVLEEKDWPDTDSFEWKKQTKIWGTNGPNGDQPTKYVMLVDCSSDHLHSILHHCGHISDETRNIVKSILIDRES
jgi:hypothetical protein